MVNDLMVDVTSFNYKYNLAHLVVQHTLLRSKYSYSITLSHSL